MSGPEECLACLRSCRKVATEPCESTHHTKQQVRHGRVSPGKGHVLFLEADVYAAIREAEDHLSKIVQVEGQPVHRRRTTDAGKPPQIWHSALQPSLFQAIALLPRQQSVRGRGAQRFRSPVRSFGAWSSIALCDLEQHEQALQLKTPAPRTWPETQGTVRMRKPCHPRSFGEAARDSRSDLDCISLSGDRKRVLDEALPKNVQRRGLGSAPISE